jgi:hypothetical protein
MERSPLIVGAMLALLAVSAVPAAQQAAQEETSMPEVKVSGDRPARPHPQDNTYSERPLGCVEVVTPSGTGNELGGHFQGRNAPSGIAVMPNLNDPTSANDQWRWANKEFQHPATPPGQHIPNPCV